MAVLFRLVKTKSFPEKGSSERRDWQAAASPSMPFLKSMG